MSDTRIGIEVTTYDKGIPKSFDIKDDLIKDFPAEAAAMVEDIKTYWKSNVGKYFSKSSNYPHPEATHQLQNACIVETVKGTSTSQATMTVELAQMFSPSGFEYGNVIIKGRSESKHHLYVPELGASIDTSRISYDTEDIFKQSRTTRGTTPDAWRAWKKDFNSYVRLRSIQFVKQCIQKGLIRRDK